MLKSKGIKVYIFDDMPFGERFSTFMERIALVDFTLLICTPIYMEKANKRLSGVGRENDIIANSIASPSDDRKYIPILFSGDWNTSIPTWAKGKRGIDFRDSSEEEFNKLIKYLRNYEMEKDCDYITPGEIVRNTNPLSFEKKLLTLTDNDGTITYADLLLSFKLNSSGREYVIYSDSQQEIEEDGSGFVLVSHVRRDESNNAIFDNDIPKEDWDQILKLMQELSQSD